MASDSRFNLALRWADRVALPLSMAAISFVVFRIHIKRFPDYSGWYGGFDQTRYLVAARAWAEGQFDPILHHYPPGYSLAAAPFVHLFPTQPFAIPDLIFWLLSLFLFVRIGCFLTPAQAGWRAAAAIAFCIATLGTPTLRQIWVIPWNTTGSAPFEYATLFGTLLTCQRPRLRTAALTGLFLGLLAGFRPSDAIVLIPSCVAYMTYRLSQTGLPRLATVFAAAALGAVAGLLPFAAAHVLVNGFSPGTYLSKSAGIGFELHLLPLRWVTLVIDSRPLLPTGLGLAEGLPWVLPGVAGILMLLLRRGDGSAREWWLLGGAIAAQWILYLTYRDLQPYGLWRFYNIHYFKWTFPFLLLAAIRLLHSFAVPQWRWAAIIAAGMTLAVSCWQPIGKQTIVREVASTSAPLPLPELLSLVQSEAFIPLSGSWRQLYFGPAEILSGDETFRNTRDFKLQPVNGGVLLQPLRKLPSDGLKLVPAPETHVTDGSMRFFLETYRFGLPCGIFPARSVCQGPFTASPVVLDGRHSGNSKEPVLGGVDETPKR